MVLPDDTSRLREPKPKGKSVALGLGTLALLFGAVGLGAMTSPDPIAAVTTTTQPSTTSVETPENPIDIEDFSIDEIAIGEPLVWEETKTLVEGVPIALTSHAGWFYLFATPTTADYFAGAGGLRVWRSESGVSWEYLGEVIPPGHAIITVVATEQGLMAATSVEDGRRLVLWDSPDGVVWEPETVPIEYDPMARIGYTSIATSNQTVVVSSYRDLAVDDLIADRIEQFRGADYATHHWGWGWDQVGGDPIFTLWGPFGFPLAEVTAEDLRLTDTEIEQVQRWNRGEMMGSIVWTRDPTGVWTQVDIPEAEWVESIAATSDGVFLANGGDNTGNTAWTSIDGILWEEMSSPAFRPWRMVPWGDGLVGPTTMNTASLLASTDGDTWSDIGPGDLFPSLLQWSINNLSAGSGGILATVVGWAPESPTDFEPVPAPTLRDEGTVLTLDYETGRLTLVAGAEAYHWTMYTSTIPDGIAVDMATGTIKLSDPESGDPLAEFSFEEIQSAEQSYWSRGWAQNETHALVFSPDGESWTIQDPVASFGHENLIQDMEVGDSEVVVITRPIEGMFNPSSPAGFSVWAAHLP